MKLLKDSVRRVARALIRASVRPEAADLLMSNDRHMRAETPQWLARLVVERGLEIPQAKQIVAMGADAYINGSLKMPLIRSINSDQDEASFFNGENTQIMHGSYISPDCDIGGCVYIGFGCHVTKATIGRYASIADSVIIGPGEHPLTELSTNSMFYEDAYKTLTDLPCSIGADAWIGAECVVRRGISIGIGAVVGANSFVNSDIPPFAIAVGSPARVIGYRISGQAADAVIESRWWEKPATEAREILNGLKSRGVLATRSPNA